MIKLNAANKKKHTKRSAHVATRKILRLAANYPRIHI
jgi:hypothetical protein